jgi:excisionase family DNA binding protein
MASLFRPKVSRYVLPDGSHRLPDGTRVNKNTPGAVRRVERVAKWYGRYTDANGDQQKVPLSESKETAKRMLAKLVGDAELEKVGLVDPYRDHRRRPIGDHLDDFRRYLVGKARCPDHVQKTVSQCQAVIEGCKFLNTDDLDGPAVVEFLAGLADVPAVELPEGRQEFTPRELAALLGVRLDSVYRMLTRGDLAASGTGKGRKRRFTRADVLANLARRKGAGVNTRNHYLASIRAFSKWLAKHGRMAADPLAYLERQNADVDRRHPRRALREEAFARLVELTAKGASFRGIAGPDRLVIYTLAANTGFRAKELGSLTPTSFDLDAKTPTVTVAAAYSKHRRADVQPLRPDVAGLMRGYLKGRPADAPLWPGSWKGAGAEMIRRDLEAAGIPYQDARGRYFDFHATRGQFISGLAAGGVHPKVAQVLARHSTITLTMDYYTHLDVLDVAGALDKLPALGGGQHTVNAQDGGDAKRAVS